MGGSGGGGSSGAVSHSAYLETVHGDWLNSGGVDTITDSVTGVMNSAIGSSPWAAAAAYNPDVAIAANAAEIVLFRALLGGLSETADWTTFYAQADLTLAGLAEAAIIADANAFAAILDADIATRILPRFRRGMQDINAVLSSAFVIGEALIEGSRNRDLAKYTASIRLDTRSRTLEATEQMIQMQARRIAWAESLTRMVIESNRISIVAKKEQFDQDMTIDEEDAKWDLEVFQFGANVLAAIAGGVAGSKIKSPSKMQSAIGGGMTGAAAGAMVGAAYGGQTAGIYGAAIGAVLGIASSYM